jgi:serine/threonine protein kinase
MAEVFRAHDERLNREVAAKVFTPPVNEIAEFGDSVAELGTAQAPERREAELRALAQLNHPNLIKLYDADLGGPGPSFLVTELIPGPNLATRIRQGPMPEQLVRTVGTQIAGALAHVHARGMVHRDVKPANILLGTDEPDPNPSAIRARLADFGVVRWIDSARATAVGFTLGTATYIAPEQARGAEVTGAADVYSLGLVLLEMFTGAPSFRGTLHETLTARLTRSPTVPAGLRQPWPGLLTAMTALDPAARPTAAQVAQALRTSAPLPVAASPAAAVPVAAVPLVAAAVNASTITPTQQPNERGHTGAIAAVALTSAAVIAAALALIFGPSSHPETPTHPSTTTHATTAAATHAGHSRATTPHRSHAAVLAPNPASTHRRSSILSQAPRHRASTSARSTQSTQSTPTTSRPTDASPTAAASRTTDARPTGAPTSTATASPTAPRSSTTQTTPAAAPTTPANSTPR